LAQEAFLRTAVDPGSLRELGRLVAYRLRPGVAAQTTLAFFVEPPPDLTGGGAAGGAAPNAFPPPTMSRVVNAPAGLAVRSVPGPGEQPQTFETVQPVTARAAWNALRATQTRPMVIAANMDHAYLAGTALSLKVGDRLLIAPTSGALDYWA